MKKLFFLAVLLLSCTSSLFAQVNDNPCYGKSNFQFVINGTTISFYPINSADTSIAHLWKFGDGSASELPNPVHTYQAGGVYRVVHYIKDKERTCYDSTVKEITLPTTISCDRLIPRFEWRADSANPLLVKFYNVSQPGVTLATFQSKWDFGDGTYSTLFDPSHQYTQAGTYKVCLTIQFPNTNCVKTYCSEVVVTKPCAIQPYFIWSLEPGSSPYAIRFTNKTQLPTTGVKLKWSFGDGTYSNEMNPLHVYATSGLYKVCLVVDAGGGCIREYCKEVTIQGCEIRPDFVWAIDSFSQRTLKFSNKTILPTSGVGVRWSFGDGTYSSDFNAVHTYAQEGVYKVCLIITTNNSCTREVCKEVTVKSCEINTGFNWGVSATAINKINFTNLTTWASGLGVQARWSFGDGTYSTEWSPSHAYTKAGTYQVCLRVILSNDCMKEICKEVVVRFCDQQPDFSWSFDTVDAKQVVKFKNTTTPALSNPVRISWNFGDGTTSTEFQPVHQYIKPGTYKVCLLVEFFAGCVREKCSTIVINPPADCVHASGFKILNQTMQIANAMGFVAEVIQSDFKYTWTFGDGTGALGPQATHTYKQPGRYTVCLTAYKNDQCASTTCKEVYVGAGTSTCEQTYLRYEYNYLNTAGNTLKFNAVSNQTIVSQKWIIQKSTGTMPQVLYTSNPTYTFQDTGWYKVCLQAVTANYCVKEYCEMVRVQYVPDVCILPVTPTPATTYIAFRYEVPVAQTIVASIIDLTGVRKSTFYLTAAAGINTFTLPISALPTGYYYLEVRAGNRICKGRFQKLN
jgi:PKD repeat protein